MPKKQTTETEATIPTVLIEAPFIEQGGYVAEHVELRLYPQQKRVLGGILRGLKEQHALLKNGRHVESLAHAILWMLEQVET